MEAGRDAGREVALREYQAGDDVPMHALDQLCFEPVFQFSQRAMRRFAEARGALTVLAEAGGDLVGFTIAQIERQAEDVTGYVVTLDVAADWRRCGLGRRLMAEIERKAAAAGAVAMELHVFEANTAAVRLYESLGYARIGVQTAFYGRGLDGMVYRKRLAMPGLI